MRRRNCHWPSFRNLAVYHEVAHNRRTQADVAAELGISQRRVSQIGQQVRAWVEERVELLEFPQSEGQRLHLAIARERMRLHAEHDPLLALFTGEDGNPRYIRRYIAVVGGEALPTVEISEKHDHRLMNHAAAIAGRLTELEAIAKLGPFADLPSQIKQTIVERYGERLELPEFGEPNSSKPAGCAATVGGGSSNVGEFLAGTKAGSSNATPAPSNDAENLGWGVLTVMPTFGQGMSACAYSQAIYGQRAVTNSAASAGLEKLLIGDPNAAYLGGRSSC
jgi:hypothetical protein